MSQCEDQHEINVLKVRMHKDAIKIARLHAQAVKNYKRMQELLSRSSG